jgi:hypothetical protein
MASTTTPAHEQHQSQLPTPKKLRRAADALGSADEHSPLANLAAAAASSAAAQTRFLNAGGASAGALVPQPVAQPPILQLRPVRNPYLTGTHGPFDYALLCRPFLLLLVLLSLLLLLLLRPWLLRLTADVRAGADEWFHECRERV